MKFSSAGIIAAILTGIIAAPTAAVAQTGNATGQFVLDGAIPELAPLVKKGDPAAKDPTVCAVQDVPDDSLVVNKDNKGIANIVLFMSRAPRDMPAELKKAPEEPAVFDQKGCQFFPHIFVLQAGQTAVVKSNDACAHNVRSAFLKNTNFNVTVKPNDREGLKFEELTSREILPMPVKCDIHPYMLAHWVIMDHPYVAVTDADGKFEIKNLPAGKHKFRVWHEKSGYLDKAYEIEVEDGKTVDVGTTEVKVADLMK